MLLEVPGWRRVRLFQQVEGDGPAFMAVHELESPAVFEHPNYEKSIATPWRNRIRGSVSRYERNLFKLLSGVVQPGEVLPPLRGSLAKTSFLC